MAAGKLLFVGPLVAGRFHVELGEAWHMSRVLWWTAKSLFLLEMTAMSVRRAHDQLRLL